MPKKTKKKASRDALGRFAEAHSEETVTEEEGGQPKMQPLQGMPGSLVEALWGSAVSTETANQNDAGSQQPGRNGSAPGNEQQSSDEYGSFSSSEDSDEEEEEDEEVADMIDHSSLFLQFVDQQRAGSENMDVVEVLVNAVDLKKGVQGRSETGSSSS